MRYKLLALHWPLEALHAVYRHSNVCFIYTETHSPWTFSSWKCSTLGVYCCSTKCLNRQHSTDNSQSVQWAKKRAQPKQQHKITPFCLESLHELSGITTFPPFFHRLRIDAEHAKPFDSFEFWIFFSAIAVRNMNNEHVMGTCTCTYLSGCCMPVVKLVFNDSVCYVSTHYCPLCD